MPRSPALQVFAGPRARARLRDAGLKPADVRIVPAAAGGPKGLVLSPLDRFLFGHWLKGSSQRLHLVGASIGAWRMAAAASPNADQALAELAEDYITQDYPHAPGRAPRPEVVSRLFGATLAQRFAPPVAAQVLAHPSRRLHVIASRGRGLLQREQTLRTPLGFALAFGANLLARPALGAWMERMVLSDPRTPLPLDLDDFPTRRAALTPQNLAAALLASCSIPFWLRAVDPLPDAPAGAYWDGGITDYHLHLPYADLADGIVLYPHFQPTLVPGWLDKPLTRRHRATAALDNVVLLVPHPDWVARLPGGKLPDRSDFKTHADHAAERMRRWRLALAEAQRLADEAADWLARPTAEALPL